MLQGKIVCEHCGSTKIAKDHELNYAVVQKTDPDTGDPIGDPITYFAYRCLSCGRRIYREKFETSIN